MAATTFNRASTQYVGDTTSDLFIRDVSEFPKLIKRVDYPLFGKIKTGSPINKLKTEWGIRHIPPVNDTVTEPLVSEAGPSTLTPANIGYYQVGHIILTPSGEKLRVSAVGASTLTVVRAQAGTSAAAVDDNAGIRIIGIAIVENADDPLGTLTQGEIDYNYAQIFIKMHQMSHRADITPTYETDNKDSRFREWLDTTLKIEMPRYMEETLLWGTRAQGSTTSPSYMGGVFQPSFYGNSVDAAGDILTEYTFLEGLQKAYNQVGKAAMAKDVMSHMFYKRVMANKTRNLVRYDDESKVRNLGVVDEYDTDFGRIRWMTNHYMVSVNDPTKPDGRMLVTDFDDYSLHPYGSDGKWGIWAVAESGWYKRRSVRGDYTLKAIYPEKKIAFLNLDTTAANYPNFINDNN